MSQKFFKHSATGFSLIEVMIVVAIVAILAAVAYPSYIEQIAKGNRSECRSAVLQVLQQQERYFGQYNEYIAASAHPASAKVKNFSGDKPAGSACYISSGNCAGKSDVKQCVLVTAEVRFKDPHKIQTITATSDGLRGCKVNGTDATDDKVCWP